GGYDPDQHFDAEGICPERGDPWYEYTFRSGSGEGLFSYRALLARAEKAEAALQRVVDAARLEGWRAGRDAAARCWEERGLLDGAEILTNLIRALPEPKETTHE